MRNQKLSLLRKGRRTMDWSSHHRYHGGDSMQFAQRTHTDMQRDGRPYPQPRRHRCRRKKEEVKTGVERTLLVSPRNQWRGLSFFVASTSCIPYTSSQIGHKETENSYKVWSNCRIVQCTGESPAPYFVLPTRPAPWSGNDSPSLRRGVVQSCIVIVSL